LKTVMIGLLGICICYWSWVIYVENVFFWQN